MAREEGAGRAGGPGSRNGKTRAAGQFRQWRGLAAAVPQRRRPARRAAPSSRNRLGSRRPGRRSHARAGYRRRRSPSAAPRTRLSVATSLLSKYDTSTDRRRKPGTDTQFPARFAGNWLSVPGFAPRDTPPLVLRLGDVGRTLEHVDALVDAGGLDHAAVERDVAAQHGQATL